MESYILYFDCTTHCPINFVTSLIFVEVPHVFPLISYINRQSSQYNDKNDMTGLIDMTGVIIIP